MTPDDIMDTLKWGIILGIVPLALEWAKSNDMIDQMMCIIGIIIFFGLAMCFTPAVALIALILYLSAKAKGVGS